MFSQAASITDEAMIKADRAVGKALFDCIFILFLMLIWSVYAYVLLPVLFRDNPFPPDTSAYWLFLIGLLIYELAAIYRYVFARGVAKKRATALDGRWQAPAMHWPASSLPDPTPTTVILDSRPRFVCCSIVYLLVLSVLPIALEYWVSVTLLGALMVISFSPLVWPIVAMFVGLSIATFFLYQSRLITYFEVTPDGLVSAYQGNRDELSWEEVRVFACYMRGSTTIYEVAGFDKSGKLVVVRWQGVRRRVLTTCRPPMTLQEYTSWSNRISDQVAAKTHLPLLSFEARTTPAH